MEVLLEEPPSCVLGRLPLSPSFSDENLGSPALWVTGRPAEVSPECLRATLITRLHYFFPPVVPLTCGAGSITPGDPGDPGIRTLGSSAAQTDSTYMPWTNEQHGIKPGDPLSPFLFKLILDPLMRSLNTSGFGYQIQGRTVSALAYADDLILVASTQEELSKNLGAAQHHFRKIKPHKTQYFSWRYEAHRLNRFD
ncbi:hypothetical protein MTO96_037889 [Rhipicephalus appendiculatus]